MQPGLVGDLPPRPTSPLHPRGQLNNKSIEPLLVCQPGGRKARGSLGQAGVGEASWSRWTSAREGGALEP